MELAPSPKPENGCRPFAVVLDDPTQYIVTPAKAKVKAPAARPEEPQKSS
jgi:hypothetical protein